MEAGWQQGVASVGAVIRAGASWEGELTAINLGLILLQTEGLQGFS